MAGSCKNAMQYGMLTDYSSNCSTNESIREHYQIGPDATNMRQFLQRNGDALRRDLEAKSKFISITGCQCYNGHPPHSEEWDIYPYESSNDQLRRYHRGDPIPNAAVQNVWQIPKAPSQKGRKQRYLA